jgi:hypothetical protein
MRETAGLKADTISNKRQSRQSHTHMTSFYIYNYYTHIQTHIHTRIYIYISPPYHINAHLLRLTSIKEAGGCIYLTPPPTHMYVSTTYYHLTHTHTHTYMSVPISFYVIKELGLDAAATNIAQQMIALPQAFQVGTCIHIYVYIYDFCLYIYIYIYIYGCVCV